MDRSFLDTNISELVNKLSLDEKISLLGAPNWWNTQSIERLSIPSLRMSDGPNGARGSSHFVSTPAQCLPCATSLGSTFDPELIQRAGVFLAEEAKIKSSVVLLAPTCNIQRSPLGGRAFESFSEDPHLSGAMAAAYVKGLQSQGVAATIKHFVCNDQEHERTSAESVLSDRALREIYLYPFMIAQRDAQPWAYMTSYGRLRGIHCAESRDLLQGVLRDEWKFNGIVMSDWYGTYSVDVAINAGMELEMPGPPRWRAPDLVKHCLASQKLYVSTIDERVTNLLKFVQHQAKLNPEVVYGDGKERTRDTEQGRAFCRELATGGIVLLKNGGKVLPIQAGKYKKVAVIGPNAKETVYSGGGSAFLKASYVVTPYAGILDALQKDCEIGYEVGCYAHKYLPTLERLLTTHDGKPGWVCTFYNHLPDGSLSEPVSSYVLQDTRIKLNDFLPIGLTETWSIKLTGKLTLAKTMEYELGLTVAGRAKLFIEGELTIDNWTKQTSGDFFYGQGTVEEKAVIQVEAGKSLDILVEYTNTKPPTDDISAQPALMRGVRLGGCEKIDPEQAIQAAERLAAESDVVIFVGGLTPEWESEGFDRPGLDLPGKQKEVIERIAKVNKKTVVVIQAGSATDMSYAYDPNHPTVPAIVQAWYQGNETGNAIGDILSGKVNPSGKLPLTLPKRVEDIAAYPNLRNEKRRIVYSEDLFVGYKHFQQKGLEPAFYFGHGLSYTTFSISDLSVTKEKALSSSFRVTVSIVVKNEGAVTGSEVVQAYVSYPDKGITHPKMQLRGFAKAKDLQPGESRKIELSLDKYAVAYWDSHNFSESSIGKGVWKVEEGEYGVHVGFACNKIKLERKIQVEKGFTWSGI
ncbi:glycoside hydrolase family 3 protein [Marasmius fiardii PR-910]|nr:glycoside hydrolase family 3 protein [Marasmius fiardii PR-910]